MGNCIFDWLCYKNPKKIKNANKHLSDGKTRRMYICRIIDGDTIEALYNLHYNCGGGGDPPLKINIRILGVDCPEMKPRGNDIEKNRIEKINANRATEFTRDLVEGRFVDVVCIKMDNFGRLLGHVRVNDGCCKSIDLGTALLQSGMAIRR